MKTNDTLNISFTDTEFKSFLQSVKFQVEDQSGNIELRLNGNYVVTYEIQTEDFLDMDFAEYQFSESQLETLLQLAYEKQLEIEGNTEYDNKLKQRYAPKSYKRFASGIY